VAPTLAHLIGTYGLVAVLLLITLDSCGVPLPSEVIMPVAGALAAAGHLSFVAVVAVGTVASLLGALTAYGLAARFGTPFLLGPGRWIGFRRRHLELAHRWFSRYGRWAVLVGRIVPVVRGYVSFPAGLTGFPIFSFSLLTVAGSLPWCAGLTTTGYLLGAHYRLISGPLGMAVPVIGVLSVVLLAAWFVRGRTPSSGMTERRG
jgi:membrane protein DedA with SNARE-associated domain